MELTGQQQEEGRSSQQLKKYVPSMEVPHWTGSNLENPETLVVTSTYDGALLVFWEHTFSNKEVTLRKTHIQ